MPATPRSLVGPAIALIAAAAASAQPQTLQNATATFSQTVSGGAPWLVSESINGIVTPGNDGWAIFDGAGATAQTAVFEFAGNVSAPSMVLDFHQIHSNLGHMLGCFRISFTTDDRDTFADGLQSGGDVIANWTIVQPTSMTLPPGVIPSSRPDSAILIGGVNPGTGVYSVTYPLPFVGITGLRLEVLEDASLPGNGPGRAANGNFVLSELTATAVPAPAAACPLALLTIAAATRRRRAR